MASKMVSQGSASELPSKDSKKDMMIIVEFFATLMATPSHLRLNGNNEVQV